MSDSKKNYLKKIYHFLWGFIQNRKRYIFGYTLINVIWALELSLTPYILKIIIDNIQNYSVDSLFSLNAFAPLIAYILFVLFFNLNLRLYDYLNLHFYPPLQGEIDIKIFKHLLNLPLAFYQNRFLGNILKKLNDLRANIIHVIKIPIEIIIPKLIAVIIAICSMSWVLHPIFGMLFFIWVLSYCLISYLFSIKTEKLAKIYAETEADLSGYINDSFINIKSIKLYGNAVNELNLIHSNICHLIKKEQQLEKFNLKIGFFEDILSLCLLIAMFAGAILGIQQKILSAGDFAYIFIMSTTFIWQLFLIGPHIRQLVKAIGVINQALKTLFSSKKRPKEDMFSTHTKIKLDGDISFKNIDFSYNENKLFQNFNLHIKGREKVGIVGLSGAGKSTLIQLLLKNLSCKNGDIILSNHSIDELHTIQILNNISIIPQQLDLFRRSIFENIRITKPDASFDEVVLAAKKAQCHDFIMAMPDQYNTIIGNCGCNLSGGQIQRIAIARAFLKENPILILDEATSSLDSYTEEGIQQSLKSIMQNKTTIVIAHRLATLKQMDRIIILDKGIIVEEGSINALINNHSSIFFKMLEKQKI